MRSNIVRQCTVMAIMLACCLLAVAQKRPTAREVIAEIQKQVGVGWQPDTVDTFKAGNPDTPVTGIAITMMATMDVLQRASAKGLNLVITHEPTFYDHRDTPAGMSESDPIWGEKRAFIEKHGMVVWRFHDHWHRRNPDGIEVGTVRALGWEKFQNPNDAFQFVMPETTLKQLAGSRQETRFASRSRCRRSANEGDEDCVIARRRRLRS